MDNNLFVKALGANADDYIRQGFTRKTNLSPEHEAAFKRDMELKGLGHYVNDDTYDNRAAWLVGALPDRINHPGMHGQSVFKGLGDDRLMLPIGPNGEMVDTRTMQAADPRLIQLWRTVSGIMNR